MLREFIVDDENVGQRIDRFLAGQMPEFSRSEIQRFAVLRDSAPVQFSEKTRAGDKITADIPDANDTTVAADNISSDFDLNVLYEDDDIIVVNKPRGVVMYPSAGNKTGTLVQNILAHTALAPAGGATRPGVVHRLDKDTSGVMVFAKSNAAYHGLVKTFMAHDLTRKYVAFVWGIPNWETATITGNIARSSRNRQKMSMVKSGGKPATTLVAVMDTWPRVGVSAFRCTLLTGRTHQIRVHLSAHGFPVLCDTVYGRTNARLGSVKNADLLEFLKTHNGQMLHAEVLDFTHPITGEKMHFRAQLPPDMAELKYLLENGD